MAKAKKPPAQPPSQWQNRIVNTGVKPAIEYMANPANWRTHPQAQRDALKGVLSEVGWVTGVIENVRTGHLIDGHARIEEALKLGDDTPVPFIQVDLSEDEERLILATLDPISAMAAADKEQVDALLQQVQTSDAAVQQMLADVAKGAGLDYGAKDVSGVEKGKQPNPRKLPIDVIYTLQMADCTCCLAAQAGLRYGIQSAHYRLCPYTYQLGDRHEVTFIDNDYFKYDHAKHLMAVRQLRPKYATVRDVMTEQQCNEAGIAFYELPQVLEWAEELSQYAENVIVIPKYDCLDKIPAKFMLGYSVPTSHGGTPLPAESFKGRRVHLLGGSWKAQLSYMAALGDDVASLDTNYVQRQARLLGAAIDPNGNEFQMKEVGYDYLTNVRYAALALSFGAIGAKVNQLFPARGAPGKFSSRRNLQMKTNLTTKSIVRIATVAALYVVLTLALAPVSFGPIQFRVSEALKCLVLFNPLVAAGIGLGTFMANLFSPMVGPWELVFMPLTDMAGGLLAWALFRVLRERWPVAPMALYAVTTGASVGLMLAAMGLGEMWFLSIGVIASELIILIGGLPVMTMVERVLSMRGAGFRTETQ